MISIDWRRWLIISAVASVPYVLDMAGMRAGVMSRSILWAIVFSVVGIVARFRLSSSNVAWCIAVVPAFLLMRFSLTEISVALSGLILGHAILADRRLDALVQAPFCVFATSLPLVALWAPATPFGHINYSCMVTSTAFAAHLGRGWRRGSVPQTIALSIAMVTFVVYHERWQAGLVILISALACTAVALSSFWRCALLAGIVLVLGGAVLAFALNDSVRHWVMSETKLGARVVMWAMSRLG